MADNGIIEIEGLEERIRKMGELATDNPMMRKRINEVIRQVMAVARKSISEDARTGLQMDADPRQAYKAVRMAVYRRIFGGQVNILSPRNARLGRIYEPPKTGKPGQRGGNRRLRTDRTTELMSYMGKDRGFILRFLNDGTQERGIRFDTDESRTSVHRGSRGGDLRKYGKTVNTGTRGRIAARGWFAGRSQQALEAAAGNLDVLIDKIIQGVMY